ncbi:MAG: ABC transporter permease [Acidobacteria bacterium]|nr:ABC transporter permease [Acidobacteriota bacterium]MBI3487110.1 ABC transporter permease [Acidobacteriota bacterium]
MNLKHALRSLLKAPAFTLTALLTLALGIGANSAMFSAIRGLVVKPLPYRDAHQLVALWESRPHLKENALTLSAPDFYDWQERAARSFEGMSVAAATAFDMEGADQAQRVSALVVSPGFFELLGVRPLLGGTFLPDMDQAGKNKVVVLGHGLWQRQFGGDPAVVGRSIRLSGESFQVLGVAPEGFLYASGENQDLYVPLGRPTRDDARGSHSLPAFGRLRPGVSVAAAQSELSIIAADLARIHPGTNEGRGAVVRDLHDDIIGEGTRPLLLLLGAVSLLLLIACTNVANLFLVRAIMREREVSLRAALGATRLQLVAMLLAEGLLVGLAGGLIGLGMAAFTLRLLPALLPNAGNLNQIQRLSIDGWTLVYTFGLAAATGLLFALAPAWQLREAHLSQDLRGGAKGSAPAGRLRSGLVAAEVALAMLLLMTAGLLGRSYLKVLDAPRGFESRQVIAFDVAISGNRYGDHAQRTAFQEELQRRLKEIPGVASVGMARFAPVSGGAWTTAINLGPTSAPSTRWSHRASVNLVSPGFFETLGIAQRQGRPLLPSDNTEGRRVVVVNESMARALAPDGQVLGLQILGGFWSEVTPRDTLWDIVGVVGDIRQRGLDREAPPMVYVPLGQCSQNAGFTLFVKSPASFAALQSAIREQVRSLDSGMALDRFEPYGDQIVRSLGNRRQTMALLGAFAALALILAGVGIYGVIAFGVTQRTREIGIRMALGAQVRTVLLLVVGQGFKLTLLGVGAGALASLFTGRFLASQMVGLGTLDPVTGLAVASLLCVVALLACLAPALRAARIDPAIALRAE